MKYTPLPSENGEAASSIWSKSKKDFGRGSQNLQILSSPRGRNLLKTAQEAANLSGLVQNKKRFSDPLSDNPETAHFPVGRRRLTSMVMASALRIVAAMLMCASAQAFQPLGALVALRSPCKHFQRSTSPISTRRHTRGAAPLLAQLRMAEDEEEPRRPEVVEIVGAPPRPEDPCLQDHETNRPLIIGKPGALSDNLRDDPSPFSSRLARLRQPRRRWTRRCSW